MLQQCTVEALIQKMNEHAGDKKSWLAKDNHNNCDINSWKIQNR